MSRVLLFLQALIIVGALTNLIQPGKPHRLRELLLVNHQSMTPRTLMPDEPTCFKVAFTALGLALL